MSALESKLPMVHRASLLNRSSEVRTDSAHLETLLSQAKVFEVAGGKVRVSDGSLAFLSQPLDPSVKSKEKYFLGISLVDHMPYFAVQVSEPDESFQTLREVATELSQLELELALHAVALSNWHQAHPYCSRCGAPTRIDLGGAARICDSDQVQHHPRTDGAVIVLVKDRADRILLGHQQVWPEGRMSNLAGFLEPGETFEQCVRREVHEESNITVSEMRYLGSQPWPFPASVMIAFEAITDHPEDATPDGSEITELRWFTRDELRAAAADGSLLLPPTISVARAMIELWLGEKVEGASAWR